MKKFINQDEIDFKILESDCSYNDISIKVQNCNFTWGAEIKSNEEMEKEEKSREEKEKIGKTKIADINEDLDKSNITLKTQEGENSMISIPTEKDEKKDNIRTHLKNINLEIKKGEMIGIVGEVGSGKSTLLQAILNNLIILNKSENNSRLILNGTVSYVSQTPWILNDTLKNNILFFKEFDEKIYEEILDLCCLKQDIEMLTGGDMTEIGEKGINLSGGQKARVALARSVHSDTDIFLLDDPISALDAHVGEQIMMNCILGKLKNKTRVLVTNAVHFLKYMDRIIFMKDGEITFFGTHQELEELSYWKNMNKKIDEDKLEVMKKKSSEAPVNETAPLIDEKKDEK